MNYPRLQLKSSRPISSPVENIFASPHCPMYGMYMSSWATRYLGWICVPPLVLLAFAQDAARPPMRFADVTESSKVRFLHRSSPTSQKYLIESMSGGTAVFDYNGDGLLDIFFVNGAQLI